MLKRKTVFIVGAGASYEFGLPIGSSLAKTISDKVNIQFEHGYRHKVGDNDLFSSIQRSEGHGQEYQRAGWVIRDGIILANSIDDFLHVHRDDKFIIDYGKAAIAKCILEAESESRLKLGRTQGPEGLTPYVSLSSCEDTWLVKLMRLLFRGTSKADRAKIFENCSFVIFNYDRCIEHFFTHALSKAYDIKIEEAAEIVSGGTFIHPYGVVGDLNSAIPHKGIPFGHSHADWLKLGRETIKTYTETVDDTEIKKAVANAETIVFLGFAYHDQNMGLLASSESLALKTIIGTSYGMSDNDVRVVKAQITNWFSYPMDADPMENILLENTTASQLLVAYAKSL